MTVFVLSSLASPLRAQFVSDPEKTDSLRVRNGDWVVGDIRDMSLGIVTYKTDAMATVRVKWSRVLTAITSKQFEIHLGDGRRFVGSLRASDTLGRVVIQADRDTVEVAMPSVIELKRIKATLWDRLDGSLNFGFDFTQQNAKTDLFLQSEVRYLFNRNRLNLTLDGSFSRQDSVSNVTRGMARLVYLRELANLWFLIFGGSAEQNSQLSLNLRGAAGGGLGRFLILTSRMELTALAMLSYAREDFTGAEATHSVPLALVADYQFFDWSGLSTDLSSRLEIQPVVNAQGRWRISFAADVTQEVVNDLYLRIGLLEEYDSRPPAADANRNDFSIRTSIGWNF